MDELKPCPFCGEEPAIGNGDGYFFVNCTDCLASHFIAAEMQKWDREMAIAAWNRRTPDGGA